MRQVDTYNREELDNFTNFITLVKKARKFATEVHKGVYRRGVDKNGVKLEYITHPVAVAKILHQHKSSHKIGPLVVACLLHDTVEDVEWVTIEVIKLNFGSLVASLVEELSSDPKVVLGLITKLFAPVFIPLTAAITPVPFGARVRFPFVLVVDIVLPSIVTLSTAKLPPSVVKFALAPNAPALLYWICVVAPAGLAEAY